MNDVLIIWALKLSSSDVTTFRWSAAVTLIEFKDSGWN